MFSGFVEAPELDSIESYTAWFEFARNSSQFGIFFNLLKSLSFIVILSNSLIHNTNKNYRLSILFQNGDNI